MLTGSDFLYRLLLLSDLIKKFKITENEKYLKQAFQICNDSESKIRKFKRMIKTKIEYLREKKERENGEN